MRHLFTILITLLIVNYGFAQWEYWTADELPTATADTAWHFEQEADQEITYSTIIDDPDITGNKLLQFSEPDGPNKETFLNHWDADPTTGATLVFRMKALEVGTYNRDWDIYLYNGAVRERLVSNSGAEIKFDKSKAAVAYDTQDWHIYRITIIEDHIELYIDEDPMSWLDTDGESNEENLFRFGDLGSSTIGTLYDWIAWDVSGAYPPGEGNAFPEELTGLPNSIEKISDVIPANFELMQNYPNPFNPTTEMRFKLTATGHVELNIYDLAGRLVRNLLNGTKAVGEYSATWDGRDQHGNLVPSGIYIYKIKTDNGVASKKMTLLK